MKSKIKLLSMLVAIVIIVSSLPLTAIFAEGGPSIGLSISADKSEYSSLGEEITYTYIIKNTGDQTLTPSFKLNDISGEIDMTSITSSLEPGQEFTKTVKHKITQTHIDEGHLTNRVEIINEFPTHRIVANANISLHLGPTLKIDKSANKSEFSAIGETIVYTYIVSNIGDGETIYGSTNGPAPGAFILNDDIIGEINVESVSLDSGKSFTVTREYKVTPADMEKKFVRNTVVVKGIYLDYPDDPIQARDTVTVTAKVEEKPSIELRKAANKKEYSEVDEIITYIYVITNTGNTKVRGDFYGSIDESFKLVDDKIGKIDTNSKPSELEPGESFTLTAEYKIRQADIDAGKLTNIAKLTGIYGNYTLEDSASVTILAKKIEKPVELEIEDKLNMEDHFQYITGYPDNTVRPEGLITREEVAAVFYRLLTSSYRDSIKTETHNFKDVKAGSWSEQSIATLSNAKIITGYDDGSFRPKNSITRAELATIASRFDKLTPFTSNEFSDITEHWANKFINSAAKKGWIKGYEDGTFKPNKNMTRAEFVTLVNNVLNRKVKKENILPEAKKFSDLLEGKWYYEAMQEAINSHHYIREKNTDYETWIDIYFPEIEK